MNRTTKVLFPLFLMASFCLNLPVHGNNQNKTISIPDMERQIWMLLNEERAFDNLPPLEFSVALSDLARKHSKDMSNQNKLSHRSSNGNSLANRLEEAGIYYIEAGENVAFSETFVAEFIHEHLIESPEHRKNILDPSYQQVGIGIVYKEDKGYYVTQDFLRPLIHKTDETVRDIIQHNINIRRKSLSIPPLDFLEYRERFADDLSKRKAQGKDIPPIPETFGETLVIFMTSPSLSDESSVFKEASNAHYDRAALGVWFAKNEKYSGGAYFLTLMLFAGIKHQDSSPKDQKRIVLKEINELREKIGLKKLKLDMGLSEKADQIVPQVAGKKASAMSPLPEYWRYEILTYGTQNLELLPANLETKLNNLRWRRIGIGILFSRNSKTSVGAFWVTLIFE